MLTSNIEQFIKETNEAIKKEQDKQVSISKEIVISTYSYIVDNTTAVDTGLYKTSHLISSNEPIPAPPTKVDFSRNEMQEHKVQGMKFNNGDEITISNSLSYAVALEGGHSKRQPAGLYKRAEEKAKDLIRKAKL